MAAFVLNGSSTASPQAAVYNESITNTSRLFFNYDPRHTLALENIVLMAISSVGLCMNTAFIVLSLYYVDIRDRHGFFIGLLIEEWTYSLARLIWSRSRLSLVMAGRLAEQVPAKECVLGVFPVVLILGWEFSSIPVFCIALQQFFAVQYPVLYHCRWRKVYAWYANFLQLLLMATNAFAVSIQGLHLDRRVSAMCYSDAFVYQSYFFFFMFLCPSITVLTSCILTLVTLRRVLLLKRVVVPEGHQQLRRSNANWLHHHSNVCQWLIILSSFGFVFIFTPNVIWVASTYAAILSPAAFFGLRQSSNCVHTFKCILFCLSALRMHEYNKKVRELLRNAKESVCGFHCKLLRR